MKFTLSRTKSLLLAAVLASVATVSLAYPALAATCNDITTSVEYTCDARTDPVSALVLVIINFMAIGVGIAVVGGITWGAVNYTVSNGDAAKAKKGIQVVINSIIGLVIFLFMYAILHFLIPGGSFNFNDPIIIKPMPEIDYYGSYDKEEKSDDENGTPTNVASACYNVSVSKADIATKDRYHRKSGQPYALENSIQGIDYAKKEGYKGIDIDVMVSKDGVLVGSHAWEPLKSGITGGFKDPLGKIKKDARLSELTLAELRRLRHEDGYRISTLEELIIHAKLKGINLIIEMKVPSKIERQLPQIAALLNKHNVKAGITSRKDKPGYVHALAVARSLGFHTRMASSPGASAKDRTWVSPDKDTALCSKFKG